MENKTKDIVYIYNDVYLTWIDINFGISGAMDSVERKPELKGKTALKPKEEKTFFVKYSKNELVEQAGTNIKDVAKVIIIKPIYKKFDDPKLLGIAKYE